MTSHKARKWFRIAIGALLLCAVGLPAARLWMSHVFSFHGHSRIVANGFLIINKPSGSIPFFIISHESWLGDPHVGIFVGTVEQGKTALIGALPRRVCEKVQSCIAVVSKTVANVSCSVEVSDFRGKVFIKGAFTVPERDMTISFISRGPDKPLTRSFFVGFLGDEVGTCFDELPSTWPNQLDPASMSAELSNQAPVDAAYFRQSAFAYHLAD